MDKLDGKTFNVVKDNIEKMRELFPDIFTEGKIDMDKFMLTLGEHVEKDKERYEFSWNGKTEAIKLAQKQTTSTLRPCKDQSIEWDNTKNLYIKGDNLEVLRTLQNSYRNKVKMIYIDPPYNTGRDFIYQDDFKDNIKNYKDRLNESLKSNADTSGRYHTDWLNMMYPRLKIAKNLLKSDGFIAVSISDEELHNLRKIMDEIFGENNFRNDLLVRRYDKNINNQFIEKGLKSLNVGSEHILIYSASDEALLNPVYRKSSEERSAHGYWKGFWNDADRPTMRYDILGYKPSTGQWKWKKELALEAIKNYQEYQEKYSSLYTLEEYWEKTGKEKKFIRRRENLKGKNMGVEHWVAPSDGILRSSNWNDLLVSESIASFNLPFDSPKSTGLLRELIKMLADKDSIILDFFSGSSSTAEAVIKQNAEDQGRRRFIMVQLPEPIDKKSKAFNSGFENICEIGLKRIELAGQKVLQENKGIKNLDIGFRVFALDDTNLKVWDEESKFLEQDLLNLIEPLKDGRSQEDVVYEVLLKYGIDLNVPVEELKVSNTTIYSIGMGYLVICLQSNLTLEQIEDIAKLQPARLVFYDETFKDDTVRINAQQILRRYKISDIRVI